MRDALRRELQRKLSSIRCLKELDGFWTGLKGRPEMQCSRVMGEARAMVFEREIELRKVPQKPGRSDLK